MTINSSASKTIVQGNGSQTQFAFSFVGVAAAYIEVIYTDAGGNETVLGQGSGASQYQITLNAPVQGALWGLGGTVTYNPGGAPIANDTSLTIFRTLPLTQAISLQNLISLSTLGNGAETGLDTLEMQLQQISEQFGRAIVAPIVDPDTINLTLPAAAQRANLVLGFDGSGDVIATTAPASGSISSAMQPVVNAASLTAGRAAFGLGAMAVEDIGGGLQDDGSGNARVLFAIQQVAANQTIGASSFLNKYQASGALVFTLDASATLWDGFGFWLDALTAPIALDPNAADTIVAQTNTSGASVTIPQGASVFLKTNGAGTWWIEWQLTQGAPVATASVANLEIVNTPSFESVAFNITFDAAVLTNAAGAGLAVPSSSLQINSNVNGLDGLDVGARAASTWYYLWAIASGSTVGCLMSLSSTAPTMPAGYTFKKYLGAVRTDSGTNFLRTLQINKRVQYKITTGSNTTTMPVIASGSTGSVLSLIGVTTIVPPTAQEIIVSAQAENTLLIVTPNADYGTSALSANPPPILLEPGGGIFAAVTASFLLEAPDIGYFSGGTTTALYCLGWTDKLT